MDGILNELNITYLKSLRPKLDPILLKMSDHAKEGDIPIVTYEVGKFLEMMTLIKAPGNVLEIGTAIGFSGIFIARALGSGGMLTTIESSEPCCRIAKQNFTAAGVIKKVNVICGNALDVLPKLATKADELRYDMVFIDAMKEEYKEYLEYVIKLMDTNGVIIIDNLLWHGQTAGGTIISKKYEESTIALKEFNKYFLNHKGLESTILPVGDGIGLATIKRDV